jgi:hypothetical protein
MSTGAPLLLARRSARLQGAGVLLLAVGLLAGGPPAARGGSFLSAGGDPTTFTDLVAHPKDLYTWDNTTITYKFDASFDTFFSNPATNARMKEEIGLAFQTWSAADTTEAGTVYSYMRTGTSTGFADIRSVALHEIGHILGLNHPDGATAFSRNYSFPGGTPTVTAAKGTEVMNSGIPAGAYNHILSQDELAAFAYAYPGKHFTFKDVTGTATPANIIIDAMSLPKASTSARGGPGGTYRNSSDLFQGVMTTSGKLDFNTTAATGVGFRTLGNNWDVTNKTGKAAVQFDIRTTGTNDPVPVGHYDGAGASRFTAFGTTAPFGASAKDDLLHSWTAPVGGSIAADPTKPTIHVGIEQDVYDWTAVKGTATLVGGATADMPLISSHKWGRLAVVSTVTDFPNGITVLPTSLLARGFALVNSSTTATISQLIAADVTGRNFTLTDLNRDTLNKLLNEEKPIVLAELFQNPLQLQPGQELDVVLDGAQNIDPASGNFLFLRASDLSVPAASLAGHDLLIFTQSDNANFSVGSFGLVTIDDAPIGVPEPSTFLLFATGGLALIAGALRRRGMALWRLRTTPRCADPGP